MEDDGARRGASVPKKALTWRDATSLLALMATSPVEPQLTATSVV